MEIGAAALALRQRGIAWHRIGAALGYNSMTVRHLASTYLMRETLQDLAARSDRSAHRHDQCDDEHDELDRHGTEQQVDHDDAAPPSHAVSCSTSQ